MTPDESAVIEAAIRHARAKGEVRILHTHHLLCIAVQKILYRECNCCGARLTEVSCPKTARVHHRCPECKTKNRATKWSVM
jgi:hypothetical protein